MLARSLHTDFLAAIHEHRDFGSITPATKARLAARQAFTSDVDVLNYALTLEHLESAFYTLASQYSFGADPFGNSIDEWLGVIGSHEDAHVEALTGVVTQLGGEPVAAGEYDFKVTDAASFLATAAAVENLGVSAYDGAGASIQSPDILLAAGGIVAVEARHAAYLNVVTGKSPFPEAVETPKTPDEVLEVAGPFIVSGT